MVIYFILLFLIAFILLLKKEKILSNRSTIIICLFLMSLVVGLRGNDVGEDTASYLRVYSYSKNLSLADIFSDFPYGKYYTWYYGYSEKTESFGLLFSKVLICIFGSEYSVQLITSCLTFFLFGKFIYDNTEDCTLPIIVLLCEYTFFSSFNLVRQFLAIGIALQSIKYFVNRKRIVWALIIVLFSVLIHVSAVFIIGIIPLFFFRNKKIIVFYSIIISFVLLVFLQQLFDISTSMLPFLNVYESYFDQQLWGFSIGGTIISWAFIMLLFILCFFNNRKQLDRFYYAYLCLFAIYMILEIINMSKPIFSRLICYVRVFLILIVPFLLNNIGTKYKPAFTSFAILIMVGQYFSYANTNSRFYSFFFV